MFGARVEIDRIPAAAPKSYGFAEKLSGRFFVSGVSGSFQKHDQELLRGKNVRLRKPIPSFQKKIDQEFMKEAHRLQMLEEKLEQIRRLRDMKVGREHLRHERKLKHYAAIRIQTCWRRSSSLFRERAVAILVNFLRCATARQAVSAAAWAARVIASFARRCCIKRLASLRKRKVISMAKHVASLCREVALNSVTEHLMAKCDKAIVVDSQSSKLVSPLKINERSSTNQIIKEITSDSPLRGLEKTLLITPVESDTITNSLIAGRSRNIVNAANVPRLVVLPVSVTESAKVAITYTDPDNPSKLEQLSHGKSKLSRIELLHQQKLLQMEKERLNRLKIIEMEKLSRLAEVEEKFTLESKERQRKEKAKVDFLNKIEQQQLENAKNYAKYREQKMRLEAQLADEEARRQNELNAMRREDWRSKQLRIFHSKVSSKLKPYLCEKQVQRPISGHANDNEKKKYNEEELNKARLAIQRRVSMRLQREKEAAQQEERLQEEKRLQQDKVLREAKVRLRRSIRTARDPATTNPISDATLPAEIETKPSPQHIADSDNKFYVGELLRDITLEEYCNLATRCNDESFQVGPGTTVDEWSDDLLQKDNTEDRHLVNQLSTEKGALVHPADGVSGAEGTNAERSHRHRHTGKLGRGPSRILQNLPPQLRATPYFNSIKQELAAVRAEYNLISCPSANSVVDATSGRSRFIEGDNCQRRSKGKVEGLQELVQRARLKLCIPDDATVAKEVAVNINGDANDEQSLLPNQIKTDAEDFVVRAAVNPAPRIALSMKGLKLTVGPPPQFGQVMQSSRRVLPSLSKPKLSKKHKSQKKQKIEDLSSVRSRNGFQDSKLHAAEEAEREGQMAGSQLAQNTLDYDEGYTNDFVVDSGDEDYEDYDTVLRSAPSDKGSNLAVSIDVVGYAVNHEYHEISDHDAMISNDFEDSFAYEMLPKIESYIPVRSQDEKGASGPTRDESLDSYSASMLEAIRNLEMSKALPASSGWLKSKKKSKALEVYEAELQAEADDLRESLLAKLSTLEDLL